MKDIFEKISYFFGAQIRPDDRSGQAKEQKDNGVRQGVAKNQRKPAEGAKIQHAAEYRDDIHEYSLPSVAERETQKEKRHACHQPEQKIRDGRNHFRPRSPADDSKEII
jgi:hypothetical protein